MSNYFFSFKEYWCGECETECNGIFYEAENMFLSDCCGEDMYYNKKNNQLVDKVPPEEYDYG